MLLDRGHPVVYSNTRARNSLDDRNGMAKVGGGWLHLPLNPLRMQKLTENYVVSNAKIKAALGIDQMPVRAKDGLMRTIRSFAK